jgi:hypothetical protein
MFKLVEQVAQHRTTNTAMRPTLAPLSVAMVAGWLRVSLIPRHWPAKVFLLAAALSRLSLPWLQSFLPT